eukprot:CAMPEP_0172472584 /NCGR_PEP_ID=MMETSP1065-20121228/68416_1 /TAXON_ID=265537 /ORGANISM="Amphiprora paludosa, Strain CCMP125" /LENGTH=160 /DNA_ID=CAMNT_0013230731 /DNA_START=538 /DNA_END=1020 /DNA_ORIENTATION=-
MAWFVAALSAAIALIAVFMSHNDGVSGYIANLYSLHSWLGILVVTIYIVQFVMGAYAFYFSARESLKAVVLQFHVIVGPVLYFSVVATILLGIQEKEGFIGCSYKVDEPDTFPLPRLEKIPPMCLVSHTLGLLVASTAVATYVALYNGKISAMEGTSRID